MQWYGETHWHKGKVFYFSVYGHWVLVSCDRRWVTRKSGITFPRQKAAVEVYACGVVKHIPYICDNNDEAKKVIGCIIKGSQAEILS